jgi:hypothetical protein
VNLENFFSILLTKHLKENKVKLWSAAFTPLQDRWSSRTSYEKGIAAHEKSTSLLFALNFWTIKHAYKVWNNA